MGTQDTGARVRALRQCCRGPTKAWGGLAAREGESGAQAAVHSAARPGAAPRVPQRVAATCPLPPGCCRVTMLCGEGGGEETDAQLQLNFR